MNAAQTCPIGSGGVRTSNRTNNNQSIDHIIGEELEPTIHPQPASLLRHSRMMLPTNPTMLSTQLADSSIWEPD
jgi:hypothetical protein